MIQPNRIVPCVVQGGRRSVIQGMLTWRVTWQEHEGGNDAVAPKGREGASATRHAGAVQGPPFFPFPCTCTTTTTGMRHSSGSLTFSSCTSAGPGECWSSSSISSSTTKRRRARKEGRNSRGRHPARAYHTQADTQRHHHRSSSWIGGYLLLFPPLSRCRRSKVLWLLPRIESPSLSLSLAHLDFPLAGPREPAFVFRESSQSTVPGPQFLVARTLVIGAELGV